MDGWVDEMRCLSQIIRGLELSLPYSYVVISWTDLVEIMQGVDCQGKVRVR